MADQTPTPAVSPGDGEPGAELIAQCMEAAHRAVMGREAPHWWEVCDHEPALSWFRITVEAAAATAAAHYEAELARLRDQFTDHLAADARVLDEKHRSYMDLATRRHEEVAAAEQRGREQAAQAIESVRPYATDEFAGWLDWAARAARGQAPIPAEALRARAARPAGPEPADRGAGDEQDEQPERWLPRLPGWQLTEEQKNQFFYNRVGEQPAGGAE